MAEQGPIIDVLDNGLTVARERLPHVHSATVGIWVMTGSANETEELAGISHFLEHLFFKGTESRSARELMESIEGKGGHMNAFTSREYTCLYVRTLDGHVPAAIEILADVLKHSTFSDLEKERNVILEEIASSMDVPEDYAHDLLNQKAWPNRALGRPVAGSAESVSRIGLDHIRDYKEAWYRPGNLYFSIAGSFDEDAVFRQVQEEFGSLANQSVQTAPPQIGFDSGLDFVERDIAQNHLAFAFPGPAVVDPQRYTYDVLSSVLGGGSTSRLFERIREDEGLAYSIYSFHAGYLKTGLMGIYAAIAPENLHQVIDLTCEELRKLKENTLSEKELRSNAEQLKGGLLIALEGTFSRMARMARSMMYFDRLIPVDEILEQIDAIAAEDIQQLAQRVFAEDQCAMALLGPPNGHPVTLSL